MKQLTIIIPFLNEGDEPLKTIISLNQNGNVDLFDVVLVHDSADPIPFTIPSEYKNVKIHINGKHCGVSESRMNGVTLSETPYILLTDAHMRFEQNGWLETTIKALEENPKTLFCCDTRGVENEKIAFHRGGGYGCRLLMKNEFNNKTVNVSFDNLILSPKWLPENKLLQRYEIPCVMGAYYAMSRSWFDYIGQLGGLYMWGSEESCLSLKTWLMGGKCILLKDVKVGHKYRDQVSPLPYKLYNWYKLYNLMYLVHVLFPDDLLDSAIKQLKLIPYLNEVNKACELIELRFSAIIKDRKEFQSKFKHDIRWLCDYFKIPTFWN